MGRSGKEHCQGTDYNIKLSFLNYEGHMHKKFGFWGIFLVCFGGVFLFVWVWGSFVITYALLQKNNQFFPSKAHDATATGLESSASYEMYDTLSVCLSLRDFHLFFPCRLLCAWLVVYSEETCPLHMRT